MRHNIIIILLLSLLFGCVAAENIVVYDPTTNTYYNCQSVKVHGQTIYILNKSQVLNNSEHNITIVHKIVVENQTAVVVYDGNMIKAYQALIAELQKNITQLKNELDKKNKLLAEYISYKKKNIELQKNITQLKRQITQLEAENEILKQQNKEYRELFADLINKQSNETKESYISAYKEWKKDISNFKTAVILAVIACLVIGIALIKEKRRYEIPL